MIARLGVSIHAGELCAVIVQSGKIRWRATLQYNVGESGAEAIASLLATAPKRLGWRRATIAIGPAWCQVKQLEGLPRVKDDETITRLVRENSGSFFLRGGHRLAVSDVVRNADGSLWAAAFDHDVALPAIDALAKSRFVNVRVVPSVSAVASLLPGGTHRWSDGEQAVDISVGEGGAISRLRRVTDDGTTASLVPGGPLSALGADAWTMAAAYGAATGARRTPFAWRPAPDAKHVAHVTRIRLTAAAALAAGAAAAAVAAPGVRAARIVRDASDELTALRGSQTEIARMQGELRRATLTLERVEQFRAQRGKTTMLLGALSQALPESTALVSLRLDTLEGSFVALAPHAADILPQLSSVTELASPKIVGSLTKETVGGAQLERATVRFRRPRLAAPASAVPAAARREGRS